MYPCVLASYFEDLRRFMTILFQVYKKIEINFMTLKISSNKYITIFYDYIKNIYIYLIIHIKYIYDINEVIKIFFKSKLRHY